MWRLAVLAALVACGGAKKQARLALEAALADPWSQESLDAATKRMTPLVEKAAGREFVVPPEVRIVDPDTFGALLQSEQRLIIDAIYKDTPEAARERIVQQSTPSARGLLGKYALEDNRVYLSKDGIEGVVRSEGIGLDKLAEARDLVLAHELVHALQDQHVSDEDTLKRMRDMEDMDAWAAAIEGLAVYVEEQVALELGLEELHWQLLHGQGWGRDGLEEPMAFDVYFRYGLGRAFILHHANAGGLDQVWATQATPPTETSQIFRPETYGPAQAVSVDLSEVMRTALPKLTSGEWMIANSRVGELALRKASVIAGTEEEFDALADRIVDGRVVLGERRDRNADVTLLRFASPADAEAFIALQERNDAAQSALLATMTQREVEVVVEPLGEDIEADQALLRIERLPISNGAYRERRSAWVRRGAVVVAVGAERFRPGLRLVWAVEAVFAALDALEDPEPGND